MTFRSVSCRWITPEVVKIARKSLSRNLFVFSLYYPTDLSLVFADWVQPPVIVQGMSCWRSYLPSCPVP